MNFGSMNFTPIIIGLLVAGYAIGRTIEWLIINISISIG